MFGWEVRSGLAGSQRGLFAGSGCPSKKALKSSREALEKGFGVERA